MTAVTDGREQFLAGHRMGEEVARAGLHGQAHHARVALGPHGDDHRAVHRGARGQGAQFILPERAQIEHQQIRRRRYAVQRVDMAVAHVGAAYLDARLTAQLGLDGGNSFLRAAGNQHQEFFHFSFSRTGQVPKGQSYVPVSGI
jgi:hypothetical protein